MQDALRLTLVLLGLAVIGILLIHGYWLYYQKQQQHNKLRGSKLDLDKRDNSWKSMVYVKKVFSKINPVLFFVNRRRLNNKQSNSNNSPIKAGCERKEPVVGTIGNVLSKEHQPNKQQISLQSAKLKDYSKDENASAHTQQKEQYANANDTVSVNYNHKQMDVYTIHVIANAGQQFKGDKLFPILLKLGFQFGAMSIFHKYRRITAEKKDTLFSLANILKPGTFDIQNSEQFTTLGVSLFFTLPCADNAIQRFDLMIQTARQIAYNQHGQLLDADRNVLTEQSIRHYREKLREYERQKLIKAPLT